MDINVLGVNINGFNEEKSHLKYALSVKAPIGKNPRQDRQDPGGPKDYYGMGYEAPIDIDALHEPYEDGPNVTSRIKQRFRTGI